MRLNTVRTTVTILLVTLLVGCGQVSHGNAHTSHATPSTSNSPAQETIAFDIRQQGIQFHVNSLAGLFCNYGQLEAYGPLEILLRHDPASYTSADIRQMTNFLSNMFQFNPKLLPLPDSFQIPITSVGETSMRNGADTGCVGDIELTNTGRSSLQIQLLDMRLTTTPQVNNNKYRFVDLCSFVTDCPGGRSGGPSVVYTYNLIKGTAGQVFSPQVNTDPIAQPTLRSTTFTMLPEQPIYILISFNSTPNNITYSLVPELTIDTSNGPQIITLTQLASTLSFVSPNQILCYKLQGNTIVSTSPAYSHCE